MIEDLIRQAIAERRPVALRYDTHDGRPRTAHPQVLFRTAAGHTCVDAYQVDGPSVSGGPLPGWRLFHLDRIVSAELLNGRFDVAPGLNLSAAKYSQGLLAHV